uniref:DDE Tnp4 domain-containing protein n=1 Tax=Aegilops tauschii subsp. strangulata TaxID=200361 RepID=A0A453HU73_AEGTS
MCKFIEYIEQHLIMNPYAIDGVYFNTIIIVSSGFCNQFYIFFSGTLSSAEDAHRFESLFKMPRKTFNYVCSLVKDDMMVRASSYTFIDGTVLSLEDRVAVALRRLNSGGSLVTVGTSVGVNHSTVSLITWRFVEAVEARAGHHLRWPDSDEMAMIKSKFEKIHGLPNCCGVVDTTHIIMCLSSAEPNCKVWLDHEKNYSMVLQAVIDPDMRFTDIVTGWPGSMKESSILHSSGLFRLCENGARLNGSKLTVSDGSEVGEYVIGDAGYPLLPWLFTPYLDNDLSELKVEFNKRHSAARTVALKALARFKDTWKFLQGEMWRPDKHKLPRIIHVCCLLHNIVIDMEEDAAMDDAHISDDHDANYSQQVCQLSDEKAVRMRDKLSEHLNSS